MRVLGFTLLLSCVIATGLAACNSVTGVNDLTFDRPATTGAGGSGFGFGGASATGGTVGHGGAGPGAGGMCPLTGIPMDPCTMCLQANCCPQAGACLTDVQCSRCAISDVCPNAAQADTATTNLYGCLAVHCAAECSGKTAGGAGGSPQTTVGQGGPGPGPVGMGTGGTASSTTMGGGPDCSMLPRAECQTCCANQNPGGASDFASTAMMCSCEAAAGTCPSECGPMPGCGTRWTSADCFNCQGFVDCFDTSASCSFPSACTDFGQCLSLCP